MDESILESVVYACDIGSVKSGSFAWARNDAIKSTPTASVDINVLIAAISRDVMNGFNVSLGFEAPLFLPVPNSSCRLNSGRNGESSRSMFAPAGAAVTTLAVQQTAWILRRLRDSLPLNTSLTFDWINRESKPNQLFIWEAFVSGSAHSTTHERDAATAVQFFLQNMADLNAVNAVTCENPFSLISAAAIWSGWLKDIAFLHCPCLVLRPALRYDGPIDAA